MSKNVYSTSEISLASALYLFYPLEDIDRTDPSRVIFIFKRGDGIDDLVNKFWKRELLVDPFGYFNSLKLLKARLYER